MINFDFRVHHMPFLSGDIIYKFYYRNSLKLKILNNKLEDQSFNIMPNDISYANLFSFL